MTTEELATNAQPVAAHPDKLREQMAENNVSTCIVVLFNHFSNSLIAARTLETLDKYFCKLELYLNPNLIWKKHVLLNNECGLETQCWKVPS